MGNNNHLAKNTMMLYFRTFLIMGVSLYSVRVLIDILGVEDYGIYNVVGGVVISLGVINASLSGASSRFVSYAIGNGNEDLLKKYYSSIKMIHWILAIGVFLLGETLGLWLVMDKLVIPASRLTAALLCFQMCLFTSMISIISVPFNALIMSYERMEIYAYISILEAVLKLGIIFILPYTGFDKLISYGVLLLMTQIIVRICYNFYCLRNYKVAKLKATFDKTVFKEIFSFAGWTFTGQLAYMGYTQGISILLNVFFGPIVNAARGIANQVQTGAGILAKNFQVAIRPQIIKSWAQGDVDNVQYLVIMTSKLGYYLTAFTVFPIILCSKPILSIWIKNVPDHTVAFVNLTLIAMLVESFSNAIIVAVHAVGNIKKFQIYESLVLFMIIPAAYVQLRVLKMSAESVLLMYIVVQILAQIVRLTIVLPMIKMSIKDYLIKIFPRLTTTTIVLAVPLLLLDINIASPLVLLFYIVMMCLYVGFTVFVLGLSYTERNILKNMILTKIHKNK